MLAELELKMYHPVSERTLEKKELISYAVKSGINPCRVIADMMMKYLNDEEGFQKILEIISCDGVMPWIQKNEELLKNMNERNDWLGYLQSRGTKKQIKAIIVDNKHPIQFILDNDFNFRKKEQEIKYRIQAFPDECKKDCEQTVESVLRYGSPYVAYAFFKHISRDTAEIPDKMKERIYALRSIFVGSWQHYNFLLGKAARKKTATAIWNTHREIVQCQLQSCDEKKTIDLQKLEKTVLDQRSFVQKHIGKCGVFQLLDHLFKVFKGTAKLNKKRYNNKNSAAISSLYFNNQGDHDRYSNAIKQAFQECRPSNIWTSEYFPWQTMVKEGSIIMQVRAGPPRVFTYPEDYEDVLGYFEDTSERRMTKDISPIEKIILAQTPWYERHANKICATLGWLAYEAILFNAYYF